MDSDVEAALEQAEAYFEESRDRTVEDGSPRRTKRRRAESTTSAEISPVEHDLGRWGSLRMQVMPTPTDLWLRAWREQNKEPEEPAYLAMDGELDFDLLQLFSPRFVRPCRGPEDRREEKDDVVACVEAEFADRMNEDQILALLDRVRYAVENAALLDPAEIEAVRGMEVREWSVFINEWMATGKSTVEDLSELIQLCKSQVLSDYLMRTTLPHMVSESWSQSRNASSSYLLPYELTNFVT